MKLIINPARIIHEVNRDWMKQCDSLIQHEYYMKLRDLNEAM